MPLCCRRRNALGTSTSSPSSAVPAFTLHAAQHNRLMSCLLAAQEKSLSYECCGASPAPELPRSQLCQPIQSQSRSSFLAAQEKNASYECFQANGDVVTVAVFAPAACHRAGVLRCAVLRCAVLL